MKRYVVAVLVGAVFGQFVDAATRAYTLGPIRTQWGATAYSPCSSGSVMADGHRVRWGAVASNTLPMHAVLRFERRLNGRRFFRVQDRGGAIMRLDIFMPSCSGAIMFGRRTIRYRRVYR